VAHTGGVIHRDLKPGNILVTDDDRPKVSDFGLAKLTDEHSISLAGQLVGTFAYMSPEQVAVKHAGIDHRTDIFSLGVVLYEMLTLVRAFEGDTTEQVAQKILWEDPVDPRILRSKVPGDLAVICVKAMEKDPGRRYLSMTELAADLRRHLAHEPIHARPPTAVQRVSKWVRRNPTKSAVVAVAVAALAIITGLWWRAVEAEAETVNALAEVSLQRDRANSQRDRAREAETDTRKAFAELEVQKAEVETQRDRADQNAALAEEQAEEAELRAADLDQVVKFQEEQLSGIDAQAMGLTIRAMVLERTRVAGERAGREPEVLEREEAGLEKLLAGTDFTTLALGVLDKEVFQGALRELENLEGQPLIQARLQDVIGKVYTSLGMYSESEPVLEKALATRRELFGNAHQSTLNSMATLGHLRAQQARYQEAVDLYEEALAGSRAAEGGAPALSFQSRMLAALGLVAVRIERFDLAEQNSLEALELAEAAGDEHGAAKARGVLGLTYWKAQRYQEAAPILQEQLNFLRRSLGDDDPATLVALNNLALNYRGLGRSDEAVPIYEELLERYTRIYGGDHQRTVTVLNNLAYVHQKQGRFNKAEPLFLLCLELTEARFGKDHELSQFYAVQVANLYCDSGRFEEAESRYKDINEQTLRMIGRENGAILQNLCLLYRSWGRLPEALAFGQRSLDYHRKIRGNDHMRTVEALKELGFTEAVADRIGEAKVHLLEALQTSARLRVADHLETRGVLSTINEVVWPLVDPDRNAGKVPPDNALIALQLITAAVEVAAADPALRDTRAWALLAAERYDEGLAESMKALELADERDKQDYQSYVERMRSMVEIARAIDPPAKDETGDR
ncbi:MAG TPA: serine/threonine-protein kinase, partial [Planctomycetota bacterium]|nr:serine/threonine-protein kinase [Planctomycetota bacterium]